VSVDATREGAVCAPSALPPSWRVTSVRAIARAKDRVETDRVTGSGAKVVGALGSVIGVDTPEYHVIQAMARRQTAGRDLEGVGFLHGQQRLVWWSVGLAKHTRVRADVRLGVRLSFALFGCEPKSWWACGRSTW
jgi:hypothetical protein